MIARPSPFDQPQEPDPGSFGEAECASPPLLRFGMKSQYVTDTWGLSGMLGTGTEGSESTSLHQAV